MNWKKLIALAYSYNINQVSEFKLIKDGENYDIWFSFNPSADVKSYILNMMALTVAEKSLIHGDLTKDRIDSNGLLGYYQALGESWGNIKSDIWSKAKQFKHSQFNDFRTALYQRVVNKDLSKMSINDISDIVNKYLPGLLNEQK